MGTWIAHLRIAERLLQDRPSLDETAFALGNLGPDSGVPNEDWSQFEPSSDLTHFTTPGGSKEDIRDLDFYREYVLTVEPDDTARYSYMLGYFYHLIADALWSHWVWSTSKEQFAAQLAEHGKQYVWTLKKDWYDLDHKYVRDHPDSLFWRAVYPADWVPTYLPYLPEAATRHSLGHIRRFYSEPKPERVLDRPYPFLNEQTMANYVSDVVVVVKDIQRQLDAGVSLDGHTTALDFEHPYVLRPYDPPLGEAVSDTR